MKKILVTGAAGFIGKNLVVALRRRADVEVLEYDLDSPASLLREGLVWADVVYHLAGVNRPLRPEEFREGNFNLTARICAELERLKRNPTFVLTSSSQADLDNPYGISKKEAEEAVFGFGHKTGAQVFVFRLPGVFGKWCRPNYNSVVATFCHNIARNLPVTVDDPAKEIDLVYIDDVVGALSRILEESFITDGDGKYCLVQPVHRTSLGVLWKTIQGFHDSRSDLVLKDMADPFIHALYATYLSYLPADLFAYALTKRCDSRGELAELLKSPHLGQIFISRTRPGVTRGNHYHDTKVEKFVVLEGEAIIRFRHILGDEIIEYSVSGYEFRVVDIPPGYTHSIENVGKNDLIVLFWADEIFHPDIPDTFALNVWR